MSEGCPVLEVLNQSEPIIIDGEEFRSYSLVMNYRLLREYDENIFFLAGTTDAGRDLVSLTWVALRTSLLIGVAAAVVNIFIGIIYGAISGYYGGKVDIIMERFSEIIARIPFLVVLSISVAYIGPGITTLFIVLIVSGWIGIASVTRTQFYRYKGREYVLASRTLGAKDTRLIFRHILPNGIGTIITASVLSIPLVIFTESTLSYLGFGIGHGQQFNIGPISFSGVSIGVLLADGRTEIVDKPYLTIFPAIIISILMITFNMFGNALRDAFNPTLRGSN
jgi:ABC-type dipeptide/oligopeptide/nickel transport system permease subunit